MKIGRLMVMTIPGSMNRTMEIVVRDVFLEALDDPELTFHIHTQRLRDFGFSCPDSAVYGNPHAFAFQPVERTCSNGGAGGRDYMIEAELKDLRAGQRHLLDTSEQYGKRVDDQSNTQLVPDLSNREPFQEIESTDERRKATV